MAYELSDFLDEEEIGVMGSVGDQPAKQDSSQETDGYTLADFGFDEETDDFTLADFGVEEETPAPQETQPINGPLAGLTLSDFGIEEDITPVEQTSDFTLNIILIFGVILIVFLTTRKWFWVIAFGFGGLASLFSMIASIIHFQILAALGFFILMVIFLGIASAIAE